jgi:hypothetical protein
MSFLHNLNPIGIMHLKSHTSERVNHTCYSKRELMSNIDRLNKEDKNSLLEEKRKLVREKFGDDTADYIRSERLASNLLFIHKYYFENKADDKKDIINLRNNIKDILNDNTNMPEEMYNSLVNILIQNGAIDSNNI